MSLQKRFPSLSKEHLQALAWFSENQGKEVSWQDISSYRPRLASLAKGIYKPKDEDFALSVKQVLNSPYADEDPIYRTDGSWTYRYFQENEDPAQRDKEYTNRALMLCLEQKVPVGVIIQTRPKPGVRYKVMGLAMINGWDKGYFLLESFDSNQTTGASNPTGINSDIQEQEAEYESEGAFDPSDINDARMRVAASIVRRQGQPKFRRDLLDAYSGKCAATGTDIIKVLEAAHVTPYLGPETNSVNNGILLRADLHTLWDLGLLGLNESDLTWLVSDELKGSYIWQLKGRKAHLPADNSLWPASTALRAHRDSFGL